MGKKHTLEYIKNYFKENNCELLENYYSNAHIKMKYKCSCGNESTITFNDFQQGRRCRECWRKRTSEKQKHTFEYIKSYFKKHNCKLLETEYINARKKLKYKCSCANISFISFDSFRRGSRCSKCKGKKVAEKQKHTFEYINKYFEDRECILLDNLYINCETKLKYKCSCENISEISFSNFRKGRRCSKCGYEKASKTNSGSNNYKWNMDRSYVKLRLKIANLCSNIIRNTIKSTGNKKNIKSELLLGYTREDLLKHLEKDPLFDNWSKDSFNYHIDHILPIKAFVENGVVDPSIINSFDNIRILSKKENLNKNGKYNKQELENFLEKKGIIL